MSFQVALTAEHFATDGASEVFLTSVNQNVLSHVATVTEHPPTQVAGAAIW